jgi:hypothetical protein
MATHMRMVMIVFRNSLEDDMLARLVRGLAAFRDTARARQDGATMPLRVFVCQCDQAL